METIHILFGTAMLHECHDFFSKNDPYIICRCGPVGSEWVHKTQEFRSQVLFDTNTPDLNFQVEYECNYQKEIQVRFMDFNLFARNDFIGQVTIHLRDMQLERTQYQLENNAGSLEISTFRDYAHTLQPAKSTLRLLVQSLHKHIESIDDSAVYLFRMIQYRRACANGSRMKWLHHQCGQSGVWNGPEDNNCKLYIKHSDVTERLRSLPGLFGTNNFNGSVERMNNLGLNKLNTVGWPELPIGSRFISLGNSQEDHACVRKFLVTTLSNNSKLVQKRITQECRAFFQERNVFSTSDFKIFVCIIMHRIHLGLEITWNEAKKFILMRDSLLKIIVLPQSVADNYLFQNIAQVSKTLNQKLVWIERYKIALAHLDHTYDESRLTLISSALMDSIMFAGGLSIPSMLSFLVTLPYSGWFKTRLPDFELSVDNLRQYVMEVFRLFPPVGTFAYRVRSGFDGFGHNVYLSLAAANQDKSVWGDDAEEFRLRSMDDYARLVVSWADPAESGDGLHNNRSCPGKKLSLTIACEFMKEFIRSTVPNGLGIDGGYPLDITRWICNVAPHAINVADESITTIELSRNWTEPELKDEQIAKLWYDARKESKFDDIDGYSKSWVALLKLVYDQNTSSNTLKSSHFSYKTQLSNESKVVMVGESLKLMVVNDEDEDDSTRLQQLMVITGVRIAKHFSFRDPLIWFDSHKEALFTMRSELGSFLPKQKNSYNDIATDSTLENIVFSGAGQILLTMADGSAPPTSHYKINLSHLSKYAVRPGFISYGQISYFDIAKKVVAIYSCEDAMTYYPGDDKWDHAKFAFRSSMFTELTLRYHLSYLHLRYAHESMLNTRETLSPNHCLRRLLKPHHYNTASINRFSASTLIPVAGLGHRIWAFTDESWKRLFTDFMNEYTCETLDDIVQRQGLDIDIPFHTDGKKLHDVIECYVKEYLSIYYNEAPNTVFDNEVVLFWKKTLTKDPLTLDNLIKHVTNTIWWVTGGHEMVGSLIEYVIHPKGFCAKVCPNKTISDVQTYATVLLLFAFTGFQRPNLIANWTHLFEDQRCHSILGMFQDNLKKLSAEIDELNKIRMFNFNAMNPRFLESSVSI
jgi:hypothetical protein